MVFASYNICIYLNLFGAPLDFIFEYNAKYFHVSFLAQVGHNTNITCTLYKYIIYVRIPKAHSSSSAEIYCAWS